MFRERRPSSTGRLTAGLLCLALLSACQGTPAPEATPTTLPTAAVIAPPTATVAMPDATATTAAPMVAYVGTGTVPAALAAVSSELGLSIGVVDSAAAAGSKVALVADPAQAAARGAEYTVLVGTTAAPDGGLALDTNAIRWDHAGFLLGLAAGEATVARQVGVVRAGDDVPTLAFRNGFLSGVRYSCATCLIDQFDLPELSDAAVATTQGGQFSTYGSDVIVVVPAPASSAMLKSLSDNGILVVGSAADMKAAFGASVDAWPDTALAYADVDVDAALALALRRYAGGTPLTGVQPMSIESGGVVLGPLHDPRGLITPLDLRDLEAARDRVASGALDVGVDPATGQPR